MRSKHVTWPISEHALCKMSAGSNVEMMGRYPFLNPAGREEPVVCIIQRHKSATRVANSGKDMKLGDQRIVAHIGPAKFDTNTANEDIAFEHVLMIMQAFRPNEFRVDHRNGSLALLENRINEHQKLMAVRKDDHHKNHTVTKRKARRD